MIFFFRNSNDTKRPIIIPMVSEPPLTSSQRALRLTNPTEYFTQVKHHSFRQKTHLIHPYRSMIIKYSRWNRQKHTLIVVPAHKQPRAYAYSRRTVYPATSQLRLPLPPCL